MVLNMALRNCQYYVLRLGRACIGKQRCFSSITNEVDRQMKNKLFNEEKQRQKSLVTRIEKIEVKYVGVPTDCTLMMNKNVSTPYDCGMHIHEMLSQHYVLAEANGKVWDMHRPLTEDCELRFLDFKSSPFIVNKAFWRSCSFLLGSVVEKAFKDEYFVELHSWPKTDVRSGSFVYDVNLKIENWEPEVEELRVLSVMFWKLTSKDLRFERLVTNTDVALKIFGNNRFKQQQIPNIAAKSEDGDSITLYRVDDHIDISSGPMIANTKLFGSSKITAVHQLEASFGYLYRFQGVSIPKQLPLNSFAFGVLAERAKKLNTSGLYEKPMLYNKDVAVMDAS